MGKPPSQIKAKLTRQGPRVPQVGLGGVGLPLGGIKAIALLKVGKLSGDCRPLGRLGVSTWHKAGGKRQTAPWQKYWCQAGGPPLEYPWVGSLKDKNSGIAHKGYNLKGLGSLPILACVGHVLCYIAWDFWYHRGYGALWLGSSPLDIAI